MQVGETVTLSLTLDAETLMWLSIVTDPEHYEGDSREYAEKFAETLAQACLGDLHEKVGGA